LEEEYGENGLELCRYSKIDAILLDFCRILTGVSGRVREDGQTSLPVVMLTGPGNEAIAVGQ